MDSKKLVQNNNIKLHDEDWVIEQFKEDPHYLQREQQLNKEYQIHLQIAKYGDLGDIIKRDAILYVGNDSKGYALFFVFAHRQPEDTQKFNLFMQQFVIMFDSKINNGFRLIYFNSGEVTSTRIAKFIDNYKRLPQKYYTKLVKFYVVHGNMMCKSWLWFKNSIQFTILKKKIVFIPRLVDLIPEGFIGKYQFVFIPNLVKETDSTHQQLRDSVESENSNLPAQEESKDSKKIIQKQQSQKILGIHLHEYELNIHGIPLILDLLISILLNNSEYLQEEGLFRKTAAISTVAQLELMLSRKEYNKVIEYDDIHTISAMIKKIFDKLAVPLVPFNYYRILIDGMKANAQDSKQQLNFVKDTINQMPAINHRMFFVITGFLLYVSDYKQKNLMNTYNLAVVFGPNFIRPEVAQMSDLIDVVIVVKTLQLVLDNHKEIFPKVKYEEYLTQTQTNRSASMHINLHDIQPSQSKRISMDLVSFK